MSVYIIAEIGVNHNGSYDRALEMVRVAAKSGVNAIKLQSFKAELSISKFAPKADYQIRTTGSSETQLEMVRRLELNYQEHLLLKQECDSLGIDFLSTPFDFESIDMLNAMGITRWKIPSGEMTNLPYLRKVASLANDVIISTGMCTLDEIETVLSVFKNHGVKNITVLHCNTEYPTPMSDVNLTAMEQIKKKFSVEIGYSDHTLGIEVPIAAAALGATVIEKHFTLDKSMEGPDHAASADPAELSQIVKAIRNIELALGDGIKRPSDSEQKNILIARKSIVAKREIKKGELFTEDNITTKRPGTGISPMEWDNILGSFAVRDFHEDELIQI